jgi:hypothetical protein
MNRQDLIKRATKLARKAAAEARHRETELASIRGPVRPGDLVVIPADASVIQWLIVKRHPDDRQLLFAVPADDNPEIGPADVSIPDEHPWGPATCRCSFGLWVEADLLDPPQRAGRVDEEVLGPVRSVLGQLAAGTLKVTPEQAILDSDPDYVAWLAELEKSREAAMAWLAEVGQVCRSQELETEAPPLLGRFLEWIVPAGISPGLAYAAEGGGLRGRISRRLADALAPRWLQLSESDGLYLVTGADGVRVVWVGTSGKPPRVQCGDQGEFRSCKWSRHGEVSVSEVLPWMEGRVTLRIGTGKARKVVMRR